MSYTRHVTWLDKETPDSAAASKGFSVALFRCQEGMDGAKVGVDGNVRLWQKERYSVLLKNIVNQFAFFPCQARVVPENLNKQNLLIMKQIYAKISHLCCLW